MAREVNHPIIASGTVAANLLRFSNATGAFFVDTDDATLAAALAAAVKHNDIVEVLDGSKRAIRFVAKEQGAGETVGANVLAGWDFTSGWNKVLGTETIVDADTFQTTDSGGSGLNKAVATNQALYYFEGSGSTTSAGGLTFHVLNLGVAFNPIATGSYRTATGTEFYIRAQGAGTTDMASLLLKAVTAPPVTGLTITSTPDGTTYNWAQITAGFDANAVTSVKVWRAL